MVIKIFKFILIIVIGVNLFFILSFGTLLFLLHLTSEPPKYVKNRAEWIRLYKIFDTEFPEPIKEEKIVKCETYFLDLLIFSEKDKPKLEKLTSNWIYIKNSKIPENLYSKIQDDPYTISGTVKDYIETVLNHVEIFSLGKHKLPDDLKPLFFDIEGKRVYENKGAILNEKLAQNMLMEMKEEYKFYRYYKATKDGTTELSLYFVYIPKTNHLYVFNNTYYTERIDYIKDELQELQNTSK
ncbi:hypothetical protein B0S90_0683 [Caldicellulosiruptor bescii]|uniref:Uncharacterized protein n=2 Tax=Caldicellulosiruptor bescii TaxID=31899 RepID=B9MN84_CALBD|nr:hypothetical protein [Caldicellulosiruptor bescii]ACM59540.1 hypothetical protein Athe_0407 [Caldicellulosiruptor bescii DSM 6725]PBC89571.1 hypothetical protein B0S87_2685 [Caldicellulosiruptor bescii]PBC89894.1 hypothetical protein B0S89_0187 [Caldicellulosiruptor bescii]PBD04680.1 hypothetical protein B0S85_2362 [Caldicellulosiruptor bescii]PBD05690.1 hypothetical protein B0S90_0683 [Caldicellulosiruptor bescii]